MSRRSHGRLRQGCRPDDVAGNADALPVVEVVGRLLRRTGHPPVSQVMAGEMKLDDAWARIDQDIADKVKQAVTRSLGAHRGRRQLSRRPRTARRTACADRLACRD
jgi:hypothetical protein